MVQPATPIAVIRSNAVASGAAAIAHLGSAATYDGIRPASRAIEGGPSDTLGLS
jgi:hypothetical protein